MAFEGAGDGVDGGEVVGEEVQGEGGGDAGREGDGDLGGLEGVSDDRVAALAERECQSCDRERHRTHRTRIPFSPLTLPHVPSSRPSLEP